MSRQILLTGVTGALGPNLLAELLGEDQDNRIIAVCRPQGRRATVNESLKAAVQQINPAAEFDRLQIVGGDITKFNLGLSGADVQWLGGVTQVIHAAADTRFTQTAGDGQCTNVCGTQNVVALARKLRNLQRFVHVSTTCVAGQQTGRIPETLALPPPVFVNQYEKSKWLAEQVIAKSCLPWTIARISTCIGSSNGFVNRYGAIHKMVQLIERGLVPMIPAATNATVDLISTDDAAQAISKVVKHNVTGILQICAGSRALEIGQLISTVVQSLRQHSSPWQSGQLEPPLIVDREVYQQFESAAKKSANRIYAEVMKSLESFLPVLHYPKTYQNQRVKQIVDAEFPTCSIQQSIDRVIQRGSKNNWKTIPNEEQEFVHA